MTKQLVIVESPAKAKTINKYLGSDYKVLASYGHVRDLVPKEGAVDPKADFQMRYDVIEKNKKHVDAIAKALKQADTLLLATDPDREGEAISFHILALMEERGLIGDKQVQRVVFHEITKSAIIEAIENPRDISNDLVNAQQARRALDYLVGFNLSPLLWRKVRPGLSAGRVQSPALRMIVEREEEIERFEAREYWSVEAKLEAASQAFSAKLTHLDGNKLKQFDLNAKAQVDGVIKQLKLAGQSALPVIAVEKKQRKRNPAAPFTTSTLQQEASRKLGFGAQRTMRTAQQLYEGIDVGQGSVGLITYMRTDSVALSKDAIQDIRKVIEKRYGADELPKSPRMYKTKSKNAQEAHEAVRPTEAGRTPEQLKAILTTDQFKLYDLIWKRTVASQMIHATIDGVSVDFACGEGNTFRATGSTVRSPGFMQVYEEGVDDKKVEKDNVLPPMSEGDKVPLDNIVGTQHFTEPPPRFSEASLVKTLEEHGIGRPSTYASIISTLQQREYALLDSKRFKPTDIGRVVNRFLTSYFTQYVDYGFTAQLEDKLDNVAGGTQLWKPLLKDFWSPFIDQVRDVNLNVQRKDVTQEAIDEACPKCGSGLAIRLGKRGRFIGCTQYPDCDYTRNLDDSEESSEPEKVEGRDCPLCSGDLVIKQGRYGKFIGCANYPKCKHIEPLEKPTDTEVECPKCHKANLFKRKSKRGKIFYSCDRYPDCDYATWDEPMSEPCPKCNWPILTLKRTKRSGDMKVCPQKECGFKEKVESE